MASTAAAVSPPERAELAAMALRRLAILDASTRPRSRSGVLREHSGTLGRTARRGADLLLPVIGKHCVDNGIPVTGVSFAPLLEMCHQFVCHLFFNKER